MKKTIIAVGMLFAMTMSATIHAQESEKKENEEGFVFTTVKENPITSIKNQNRAGNLLVLLDNGIPGIGIASYGKG